MSEQFQIMLTERTRQGGEAFTRVLDQQIDELSIRLDQLKHLRGNVARTFGIDRQGSSPMTKLLDGANRRVFEGDAQQKFEDELEKTSVAAVAAATGGDVSKVDDL